MTNPDPLFSYLAVLAVIQPARIQDIEAYALMVLPESTAEKMRESGDLRRAHTAARNLGYVLPVRRGTFFLTDKGREIVRRPELASQIDNLRMFLMKDQRRRYR